MITVSLISVALSISAALIWYKVSRLSSGLSALALWPVSWLVNVAAFNALSVINLLPPHILNVWAAALVLHACIALAYGIGILMQYLQGQL